MFLMYILRLTDDIFCCGNSMRICEQHFSVALIFGLIDSDYCRGLVLWHKFLFDCSNVLGDFEIAYLARRTLGNFSFVSRSYLVETSHLPKWCIESYVSRIH